MLPLLAHHLEHYWPVLRIFQYITFRSILGALTALIIALILGPYTIRTLTQYKIKQFIHEDVRQHVAKAGTPTMGGAFIMVAIALSTLLWADLTDLYVWVLLLGTLAFGTIGFVDDYRKLTRQKNGGIKARTKYLLQSIIALLIAAIFYYTATSPTQTQLVIPFFKDIVIHMGAFYILMTYFVIVGTSNAVNLTDGLDGLAILPTVMVACALGVFAYVSGNVDFAKYLAIPYVPGAGEATVFGATLVGAGLGFLWYNAYPAQVFMGDVGSLGLGAALGIMAVIVRQEIVLIVMGGIFVAETLSVILQVASFKLTGKRIFRMSPLHHHFELKGWPETRVIVRFWIITFVLVLCGLATLKLR